MPREMLLLLKMNDCLRHIDRELGAPVNSSLITAEESVKALLKDELEGRPTLGKRVRAWWDYYKVRTAANQAASSHAHTHGLISAVPSPPPTTIRWSCASTPICTLPGPTPSFARGPASSRRPCRPRRRWWWTPGLVRK